MSHRRVKNIDYDDNDDFENESDYGYEGAPPDSELTPDEFSDLQAAIVCVRTGLGAVANSVVTDREIRDAVWEAYFDADAVVADLKASKKVKQAIGQSASTPLPRPPQRFMEIPNHPFQGIPSADKTSQEKPLSALQRRRLEAQRSKAQQQTEPSSASSSVPPSQPASSSVLDRLLEIKHKYSPSSVPENEPSVEAPPPSDPAPGVPLQGYNSSPSVSSTPRSSSPPPAPRVSKLAALAAARRKAKEDAALADSAKGSPASQPADPVANSNDPVLSDTGSPPEGATSRVGKAMALLDRLSLAGSTQSFQGADRAGSWGGKSSSSGLASTPRRRDGDSTPNGASQATPSEDGSTLASHKVLGRWSSLFSLQSVAFPTSPRACTSHRSARHLVQHSQSDFAAALLGPSTVDESEVPKDNLAQSSAAQSSPRAIPYFTLSGTVAGLEKNPFSAPSPDDLVLKAQEGAARLATTAAKMEASINAAAAKRAAVMSTMGPSKTKTKDRPDAGQVGVSNSRKAAKSDKTKAAVAKGKKGTSTPVKGATSSEKNDLIKKATKGVAGLGLTPKSGGSTPGVGTSGATTPTKGKIDVLSAWKESRKTGKRTASFVVIGHVDHGKSTLMGQLLVSLSLISKSALRSVQKTATSLNKSSFALAFLLDSHPDERERGVTVDVSTRHFETESTKFTILDAPGHRDFVPNMIAGVAQADFPLLVVDARADGFEAGIRGQTNEHAVIARSASGATGTIVVAINKMDAANWSETRFEEIRNQMTGFLSTLGYGADRILCVPCAGLTGDNVVKRVSENQARKGEAEGDDGLVVAAGWYEGPTLLEALECAAERMKPQESTITKPLRFEAYDVHRSSHSDGSVGGFVSSSSIAVGGRVLSGSVQIGDHVVLAGSDGRAIVRAVEVGSASQGAVEPLEWAVAGSIVTLHLSAVPSSSSSSSSGPALNLDDIQQGDIFTTPEGAISLKPAFRARILALETLVPGPVDLFTGVRMSDGVIRAPIVGILDLKATASAAASAAAAARSSSPPPSSSASSTAAQVENDGEDDGLSAPTPPPAAEPVFLRRGPKIVKAGSTAVIDFDVLSGTSDKRGAEGAGAGGGEKGGSASALGANGGVKSKDWTGTATGTEQRSAGVWAETGRRVIVRVEGRTVGMGVMV